MAKNKVTKIETPKAETQSVHCAGLIAVNACDLPIQRRMATAQHLGVFMLGSDAASCKFAGKVLENSVEKSHPYNPARPHTMSPFFPNIALNAKSGNAFPAMFAGDGGWTKPAYYHLVGVAHAAFATLRANGACSIATLLATPAIQGAKYARQCVLDMVRDCRAISLAFTTSDELSNETIVTYNAAHKAEDYKADWPQLAAK